MDFSRHKGLHRDSMTLAPRACGSWVLDCYFNMTVDQRLVKEDKFQWWWQHHNMLTHIINKEWMTECPPEDWTRGVILPMWQHRVDKLVCMNHKGITLPSSSWKIFTRIIPPGPTPDRQASCWSVPHKDDKGIFPIWTPSYCPPGYLIW